VKQLRLLYVPTIVATNGTYLLGQDTDPADLRVADLPAEYADPIVNYRNWTVLDGQNSDDSGYFFDTSGAHDTDAAPVDLVVNFSAWGARSAEDEMMSSDAFENTTPEVIGAVQSTVARARGKKRSAKRRCGFIDDEAECSGDDGDDDDDEGTDGDKSPRDFIVTDHDSESADGSDSGSDGETEVSNKVAVTRSGRLTKPTQRFDAERPGV
jgi:hypothetical protein